MKILIVKDYETLSEEAFKIVRNTVKRNPCAVLGLATGTTPLGLYKLMVEDHKKHGTSYACVRTVNLDEYKLLPADHCQSYAYFMKKNLFDGIDINADNTYIENGMAESETAECERYNLILKRLPRDLQLLGLGSNGHIAFNEPGTPFDSETHVVKLAESTVRDNSRLFSDVSQVPAKAYTMGLKNIMEAAKVLILAFGKSKAEAVYGLVEGDVVEAVPASILQRHKDCILICDEAAASRLSDNIKMKVQALESV